MWRGKFDFAKDFLEAIGIVFGCNKTSPSDEVLLEYDPKVLEAVHKRWFAKAG